MKEQIVFGANITGLEGGVVCVNCATEGLGLNTKDTYILFEVDRNVKVINPLLKVVIRDKGLEGIEQNNFNFRPHIHTTTSVGMSSRVEVKTTSEKGVTFNGQEPPLYTDGLKRRLFW